MADTTATVERHEFGAEVGRLLDLVVHSLYSEREIFLRELVANAADAIDRRRFEALTQPALALQGPGRVRIVPDRAARTLAIEDDGIGMSHDELAQNLGTIARSGTRAFGRTLENAKPDERPALIGQFGVGFYAAFMVAERVEVTSRRADAEVAWTWASDGGGQFTLAPAERPESGTTVTLHMKADADEFLEPVRLENVVRKWAEHVTVPVVIARDGRDEPANEGTALWRRPRAELSESDYEGFYRHLGHFLGKPWATLHWRAEGSVEFTALLFIPDSKPFMAVEEARESRLRLHVRRMFITNEAELLPPWLRFVDGVVDTEDLPLNVSREMLQATPVLARIRRAVTNRVLSELKAAAKDETRYATFWENFGPVLKEGVWEDNEHRGELAPLLRFRSSAVEGWTSLPDYVARMKDGQQAIYVLAGEDIASLARSSQLEGFRARGLEVLLMADPIDSFWPGRLDSFDGKPIRSVTRAQADLAGFAVTGADDTPNPAPDVSALADALKAALGDAVSGVRATDRLTDSAVVLAADDKGPDLAMQRLLRRAGRAEQTTQPVLEINPRHRLIGALASVPHNAAEAAGVLLDLARVQDGEPPRDPAAFARALESLMVRAFGGTNLTQP